MEAVAVIDLAIGDAIECYLPSSDAFGSCEIFYAPHAIQPPATFEYVVLSYSDRLGATRTASATAEHLVLVSGNGSKPMAALLVGDVITVSDDSAAAPYQAPITALGRTVQAGAFDVYLLNAGMPVVDGVVFYPYINQAHTVPGLRGNALMYMLHAPLWQAYARGDACLDDEAPCTSIGKPLASYVGGLVDKYDTSLQAALAGPVASLSPAQLAAGLNRFIAALSVALARGQNFTLASMIGLVLSSMPAA